ncbi:MAG: PP2C family serine/threonine-protein phosphatase [Pyrinomonadaceae bacterium]
MMMNGHQFTSAAVSDRGLNPTRLQNEDSYAELKQYGVFVVADGVGGAQAGEVASQMAVEILGEAFINIDTDADPEDTMRIAIERANGAIFQMSQDLPQLASMATTLVALHVAGDIATIANVGDSRIYRVDANGRMFRETDDHSVVEEEVRAGRMTPEQALNHPSRNVISRALGAEDTVEPDIKMLIVHPATTFLLCSDGITRHIDDAEIESLLASDGEPSEICEQMKKICFDRGAEDNLTAVIVKFAGERQAPLEVRAPPEVDDADDDQVTIAAARSPFESVVEPEAEISHDTINIAEEIENDQADSDEPVIAASANADHDDGSYLLENPDELFADEPFEETVGRYTSSKVIVPAHEEPTSGPEPGRVVSNMDYNIREESSGFLGKAASALGLLIAGGLIGMTGAYFMLGANEPPAAPEAPVITQQKSNNVSLTAFEEGRRQVDSDPAKYISLNPTPQVPEDYFLLARAFLLTGKYWDAKRFYGMAKDRLSQAEPNNAKMMATEIAMAKSIIDSPQASQQFAKETAGTLPQADVNTNTVFNSADPAPLR